MAQLTFESVWKKLLAAWAIQVGILLAAALGLFGLTSALNIHHNSSANGANIGLGLLVLLAGYIIGTFAAQKYLTQQGFTRAALITWLSVAIGLILPLGNLVGFLILGYIIEREARKSI